jgi:hypothetical protein
MQWKDNHTRSTSSASSKLESCILGINLLEIGTLVSRGCKSSRDPFDRYPNGHRAIV